MTTNEKLTPVAQQMVPKLREKNRIERRSRPLTWTLVAAAVVVVASLVYLGAHAQATDETTNRLAQQGHERDAQISDIQSQLKGVCKKVANPNQLSPAEREGCYRAENSLPPPVPVTVTAVPTTPGISAAQAQSMIATALAQVPRPLTVDQVTMVAQQVYAQNAPSLLTNDRLATAVAAFCAGDACRGPQGAEGKKGAPAPPITDAQIRAQVDAFCAANNGCVGPAGTPGKNGDQGAQGISVQGFGQPTPDPDASDPAYRCRVPVTLRDPSVTPPSISTVYFNVPTLFCLPG